MVRSFILILMPCLFLFTACGETKNTNDRRVIPDVNDNIVELSKDESENVVIAKERYKIAVLFPFQGIPFWVNEAYGIFDQASMSGVDVIWRSADGYENVDKQIQQLSEMKALGIDAVLLGATNYAGTRAAAEDLIADGIPVINHVTSTNSDKISSRVLVNYTEIGRRQAEYILESNPDGGKIIMLNGPAGAEWSANEVSGFKTALSSNPDWVVVAERNSNPDRVSAQRFMEDLLVRFPDVTAVFSVTDSLAMGAVDALNSAGKAGNVIVTTAGFSPETVVPIRDGLIHLNVDESPVLIGRAALNTAVSILNGDEVPGIQYAPTPSHTKESIDELMLENQWAEAGWTLP